jgi:hypothetical protein
MQISQGELVYEKKKKKKERKKTIKKKNVTL